MLTYSVPFETSLPIVVPKNYFLNGADFKLNFTSQTVQFSLSTKFYLVTDYGEAIINNIETKNDSFTYIKNLPLNPLYFPLRYSIKLSFLWGGSQMNISSYDRYMSGREFNLNLRKHFNHF
jgi:hypothetical protein